jgi:hypothetical protein
MTHAIVGLALLLAAPAAPQQFNLECAGTTDVIFVGGQTSTPYKRTLRIDLATKQWCADECSTVEPIAAIQPKYLMLRDVTRDTPRSYWRESESVDRTTGYHSSRASNAPAGSVGRSSFSSGKCELARFTGFVSGATKF